MGPFTLLVDVFAATQGVGVFHGRGSLAVQVAHGRAAQKKRKMVVKDWGGRRSRSP